jgi:trimethylamine---corrinoid protein Co-methyltransferase
MKLLRILTQSDRKKINATALRILSEIGVKLHGKSVLNLLLDAGALPDKSDPMRIYLPEDMVRKYIGLCPRQFTVKNRHGKSTDVKNGGKPLYYSSNAITYTRGTSRTAVEIGRKELADFVRVLDSLEHVDGAVGTGIRECAPKHRDFAGFSIMARNTCKHLRPCIYTPDGAEAILEMADAINGGGALRDNMFFTLGYSIVSPLTWSETALELFMRTRGHGIPVMVNSEPMAGGTSPVTLAGSLALADAEVMSGIVINQLIEPGRPCIYNSGFAHVLDMMTTLVLTGAPENALLQGAGAEMAAFHSLPCASWALSDSLMLDGQASYEKLMTLFVHTISHVNMVWGVGNTETSKTISPEAAYIDNELIGDCLRFQKGIEVDDEHLAYNVIKDVAFKGSFLDTGHTLDHFRQELRNSRLPNRVNRVRWEQQGSRSIEERAGEAVNAILAKEPVNYLTGAQMDKLDAIERDWKKRIGE